MRFKNTAQLIKSLIFTWTIIPLALYSVCTPREKKSTKAYKIQHQNTVQLTNQFNHNNVMKIDLITQRNQSDETRGMCVCVCELAFVAEYTVRSGTGYMPLADEMFMMTPLDLMKPKTQHSS